METQPGLGGRIVVPLDGSPLAAQAIPYARAVAAPDAAIVVLWVVPDPEPMRGGLTGQVIFCTDDILRADEEAARRALEATAARLRPAAGRVDVAVAVGDPARRSCGWRRSGMRT